MNPMERVLSDDLTRLIDRLSTPIDELEAILGGARASLIETYARWARALKSPSRALLDWPPDRARRTFRV